MPHYLVNVEFKKPAEEADLLLQKAFLERVTAEKSLLLAAMLPEKPGHGIAILEADSKEAAIALYSEAPLSKKEIIGWTMTQLVLTYGSVLPPR